MTTLFDLTLQVAEKVCTTYEGIATGGSHITLVDSNLANIYPDDFFNGGTLWIRGGVHINKFPIITDYTGSSGTFAFANLGLAVGDGYTITQPGVSGTDDQTSSSQVQVVDGDIAGDYADDFWNGYSMVISRTGGGVVLVLATVTITDYEGSSGTFSFADCGSNVAGADYAIAAVTVTSTLTAGTSISATDSSLADTYPNDFFNGSTLTFTSGNHDDLGVTVTDYVGHTGVFSFANIDVDSGDLYTAARINFPRGQLIQAVNAGLRAMGPFLAVNSDTHVVADQEEYVLEASYLDVLRVEIGDDATPFEWEPHYWWRTMRSTFTTIIFDDHVPDTSGDHIRIWYTHDHPVLDTADDAIVYDIPIERLVEEAALQAFRLRTRLVGDDDPNLLRDIKEQTDRVMRLRFTDPVPMIPRDPHLAKV